MAIESWMVVNTLAALSFGAAGGVWWARRSMSAQSARAMADAAVVAKQQQAAAAAAAAVTEKKLRQEVEQLRAGNATQVAAALAAEKAHAARLDARLTMAYAELDRLREAQIHTADQPSGKSSAGFADTQIL